MSWFSNHKEEWEQYKKDNLHRWDKKDIEFFTRLYDEFREKVIQRESRKSREVLTIDEKKWKAKVRKEIKQRRLAMSQKYR